MRLLENRIFRNSKRLEIPSLDLTMEKQKDEELKHVNIPSSNDYKGPKLWKNFVQHWPIISQSLALLIICFVIWAIGYSILPDYTGPNSTIVKLAVLFIGAQICGILVTFIHLPDMLGMLFWGVFYTNFCYEKYQGYERFEGFLRELCLINLMLLAGLSLQLDAFKKLWLMILRLTFVPLIVEVSIIAVLTHFLLHMPWLWGCLLGLVITATSPNVVVTVMLSLKEQRLGLNNGIHTLIYSTTTCSDVASIFFFNVLLSIIFSTGSLALQLLQGPVGIGIGIVFGFVYGLFLLYVPSKYSEYANSLRCVLTILGGTISVIGSKAIEYPAAGTLGCVIIAFVAGVGWQRQSGNENFNIDKRLNVLWKFLKPVSFSLIGKEVDFALLDLKAVGFGLLIILVSSLFRLAVTYLTTYGGGLTWKERAYITISGFPKATVQAVFGPIALDMARLLHCNENTIMMANNILIISVLAIIITAPLGAILMVRLAPICLSKSPPEDINERDIQLNRNDNERV